jgi:hypothetical protein
MCALSKALKCNIDNYDEELVTADVVGQLVNRFRACSIKNGRESMLRKIIRFVCLAGGLMSFSACSTAPDFVIWQEEVRLNDGRVVVVTQKRKCEGAYTGGNYAYCIAREAWLTINLPQFSAQEIVWHEHLQPMILNIYEGKLFVVGTPPSEQEFHLYGSERPPYFGFVWDGGNWKRIPFKEIPEQIYDSNLLMNGVGIPPSGMTYLPLDKKESREMNGDLTLGKEYKRIDPSYGSNFN